MQPISRPYSCLLLALLVAAASVCYLVMSFRGCLLPQLVFPALPLPPRPPRPPHDARAVQVSLTEIKMSTDTDTGTAWQTIDSGGHDISGHQRHSNGIRPAAQGQGRRLEAVAPQRVTVSYTMTL